MRHLNWKTQTHSTPCYASSGVWQPTLHVTPGHSRHQTSHYCQIRMAPHQPWRQTVGKSMPQLPTKQSQQTYLNSTLRLCNPQCSVRRYPPGPRRTLLHSNGYTYLLTVIDRFTHWPEAFPLQNITAEAVARTFLQGWVARFGTPTTITTDRGSQFQSGFWNDLMVVLGTQCLRTNAYHPQANGLIERFHWQLKGALKCHKPQDRWTESLPWALLVIRSAVKEDSRCTAAEMVYSSPLRVPGEFIQPHTPDAITDPAAYAGCLRSTMATLSPASSRQMPLTSTYLPAALDLCTHVFVHRDSVKRPLQSPYDGPFRVIRRTHKYYNLRWEAKWIRCRWTG